MTNRFGRPTPIKDYKEFEVALVHDFLRERVCLDPEGQVLDTEVVSALRHYAQQLMDNFGYNQNPNHFAVLDRAVRWDASMIRRRLLKAVESEQLDVRVDLRLDLSAARRPKARMWYGMRLRTPEDVDRLIGELI